MARFGRDLVRSLTQPAFIDEVSKVGMLAGSLPARQKEEEKQKTIQGMFSDIAQAEAEGDVNTVAGIYESLGKLTKDSKYVLKAGQLRNEQRLNTIQTDIAGEVSKLNDPSLSDADRATIEAQVKEKAKGLNDPQIFSNVLSNISTARSNSRSNMKIVAQEAVSSGMSREEFITRYGPEDAILYDISKSQALTAKNSIEQFEEQATEEEYAETMQGFLNQFEAGMAVFSEEIDQEKMLTLQQQIVDFAEAANKPVAEYVEMFKVRFEQKIASEMDAEDQERQRKEADETRFVDGFIQSVINSGSQDPSAFVLKKIDEAKDPYIKELLNKKLTYIKTKVEDHFNARREIQESFKTGELSATALDFLSDPANKTYFEGVDSVENAFDRLQKLNAKVNKGGTLDVSERQEKRALIKLLNEEVAKARGARRDQELSEPMAKLNAERAVDLYLSKFGEFQASGVSRFFGGDSVYDLVEGAKAASSAGDDRRDLVQERELYKRIKDALKREYMLRPNVPAQERINIIRQTVEEFGTETSGEEAFQTRVKEAEFELNQNRALISDKVKQQNPKRKNESESDYTSRIEVLSEDGEVITKAAIAVEEDLALIAENELRERRELISRAQTASFMGR